MSPPLPRHPISHARPSDELAEHAAAPACSVAGECGTRRRQPSRPSTSVAAAPAAASRYPTRAKHWRTSTIVRSVTHARSHPRPLREDKPLRGSFVKVVPLGLQPCQADTNMHARPLFGRDRDGVSGNVYVHSLEHAKKPAPRVICPKLCAHPVNPGPRYGSDNFESIQSTTVQPCEHETPREKGQAADREKSSRPQDKPELDLGPQIRRDGFD